MASEGEIEYQYRDAAPTHAHGYLAEPVLGLLNGKSIKRIIDLGCGNGSFADLLSRNFQVVAIDTSESGIAIAKMSFKNVEFHVASVYDDLASQYGKFDAVVSLEVVEHLYDPRRFISTANKLVGGGGYLIISTPYHGYLKNLVLAASGKLDGHFTALWDGGHIKFWSIKTITELLNEQGFAVENIERVGRVPPLAKSMVIVARKR